MKLYYRDFDKEEKTDSEKEREVLIEIKDQIKELNATLVEIFLIDDEDEIDEDEPQEVLKKEIELRQGYTPEMILNYLDNNIRHWRRQRVDGESIAKYYIDAYQSVRISLFGKELKRP